MSDEILRVIYSDLVAYRLGLWEGPDGFEAMEQSLASILKDRGVEIPSEAEVKAGYGDDECDEGCAEHASDCDGFCDHTDHQNACFGPN